MGRKPQCTGLGWPLANGTCVKSRLTETRHRHEHDRPKPSPAPLPPPPMTGPPPRIVTDVPGVNAGRHPVLRRDPERTLPLLVRWAVLLRDQATCKRCGTACVFDSTFGRWSPVAPHIDHVTPWSAGGADRTENLRVLCGPCNLERSNYRDEAETRTFMPATWWCLECWGENTEACCEHRWRCWVQSGRTEEGIPLPVGLNTERFAVERVRDADTPRLAYCAHCRSENYTTVWL